MPAPVAKPVLWPRRTFYPLINALSNCTFARGYLKSENPGFVIGFPVFIESPCQRTLSDSFTTPQQTEDHEPEAEQRQRAGIRHGETAIRARVAECPRMRQVDVER